MPDFDIREVRIDLAGSNPEGAVPMPDGWEPFQVDRLAGEVVVLCKRERTGGAPLNPAEA
jgi:hypothetical protein